MPVDTLPPRLARWLLQWALTGPTRSAIVGDIEEEFVAHIAPRLGPGAARRWYWRQTLLSIAACLRGPDAPDPRPAPEKDSRMSLARRVEELRHDTVGALRQMRRAPGFTALAVTTLALGIGANSAIFALVDATLLRPLPVREPDRLVMLSERTAAGAPSRVSPPNLIDWRERTRSFESLAGFAPRVGAMVMPGTDGVPESVSRQWVTAAYFDVFGVGPLVGRTFTEADNAEGAPDTAVINETFWRTRFGGDPGVVGRIVRLDGDPYTIVGVVPRDVQLTGRTSLWAIVKIARQPEARGAHYLRVVGRLRDGVSPDAARADLESVSAGLASEFPAANAGRRPVVEPLHDALIGSELRLTSLLFLGVVGFVLLICCANVAHLLLARAAVRRRELAIRAALGAGRARVVRQLVTESLVLAIIGGAVGLAIGAAIASAAPTLLPAGLLPPAVTVVFDLRVAAFCVAATLAVGLVFGVAPAWQGTDVDPATALAADSRSVAGGSSRLRGLLVAAEVATAVVLLAGAGLLLRTLVAVETFDRGYRAPQTQVLTLYVDPIGSRYPTREALLQFYEDVRREAAAVPGVASVAWTSQLPLTAEDARDVSFEVVGDPAIDERRRPAADSHTVSPGYFAALDLPIVAGRGFTDRDTADSPPVCLVNEALVRGHAARSLLGERLALRPAIAPSAEPTVCEIVGVVRQVRGRPDERQAFVQIYRPLTQRADDDIFLVVRSATADATALTAALRAAIGRVDRDQLVGVRDVRTLEDVASAATERHRFRAVLVVTFAGLALTLAMVGVFGVVGLAVQQRLRDFAVRRALGASAGDVARLVVRGVLPVLAGGVAVGLLAAAALGRVVQTVLVDVDPLDPLTFAATGAVLVVVAMLAIASPLRRALRIDPARLLRGA
jgi:putative ABC transport system permease protein